MNKNKITITRKTLNVLKNTMVSQEYRSEKYEDMTYEEKDGFTKIWRYKNREEHITIYRTPRNKGVTLYIESHFELHGIIAIRERIPDGYVCLSTRDYNWIELEIIEDTEVKDQ